MLCCCAIVTVCLLQVVAGLGSDEMFEDYLDIGRMLIYEYLFRAGKVNVSNNWQHACCEYILSSVGHSIVVAAMTGSRQRLFY